MMMIFEKKKNLKGETAIVSAEYLQKTDFRERVYCRVLEASDAAWRAVAHLQLRRFPVNADQGVRGRLLVKLTFYSQIDL